MFRRSKTPARSSIGSAPILIRPSTGDDAPALAQLAAVDSTTLPEGELIVAEVDGRLVAAVPLDPASEPLADPFRPSAEVVDLLLLRTRHIRAAHELRRAA